MSERHMLIYDADCGFCQWSADRLISRGGPFEASPNSRHPELKDRSKREIIVRLASGRELGGANAVLFILSQSGWGWFARMLMLPPFIWVLGAGYWIIARNRQRISRLLRLPATCSIER
ncbi:MAG: DUF393 domain-containing protein [Chthonomonas sp.]|nr:DUF393 domain-containing protein [Chthonomonas sp.]